jgi:hypothetical protein
MADNIDHNEVKNDEVISEDEQLLFKIYFKNLTNHPTHVEESLANSQEHYQKSIINLEYLGYFFRLPIIP